MRFQDELLLQRQQAEQERQHFNAQKELQQIAESIENAFQHHLLYRDPFEESAQRIQALKASLLQMKNGGSISSGSSSSSKASYPSKVECLQIEHENGQDVDPTAFSLFKKIRP